MLEPVQLPNDVKSIEFRKRALVEELAEVSHQTSEVKNTIAALTKDIYFTKNTLEETKYSVEIIKYELRELRDPIDTIQAKPSQYCGFLRLSVLLP